MAEASYRCWFCGKPMLDEIGDPVQDPDNEIDWVEVEDRRWQCFSCRPKVLPQYSEQQVAALAARVLDLETELQATKIALQEHACLVHLADLEKAWAEVDEALSPFLANGPNMVFAVADGPSKSDSR